MSKNINLKVLVVLLLSVSINSAAANEHKPKQNDPFELDPIEVTLGKISFEEELTLRIVRQGFKERASNRQEDRDKVVCWLSKPTGSRLSQLDCARNGDVWASRPDNMRGVGISNRTKYSGMGYGDFMIASRPITRGKLETILAALPGSDAYDKEFIKIALAGDKPPRDIPNEKEIEQFAKAWVEVGRLNKQGKSEDIQVAAITAENLTLKRYNRIAELSETYASLKEDIASRVKQLR